MKILFIAPHLSTGGMPQYLLKKIELLKDDCEIYCIEYQNITGGKLVVQRSQIKNLLGDKLITLSEDKKELINFIERINPQVIHFEEVPEYFCDTDISKQIYKKDRKYKIVETSHDSSFDVETKMFFPDKFAFVSEYQKDRFSSLGVLTEVVEYPIEKKEKKYREKSLIDLGLDPNKTHFLNVGLFTPRKNQSEIIEYADKLINDPVQFHFIGNQADNFKDYWEPLMQDFPVNCKFWGERKDVDNFYNAMDVFLFTSKGSSNDKETSPLVLKEAIGWGMPVLMRRLSVYNGMHDKFPNVHYIGEDLKTNLEIINKFKKSYKKSYFKKYSLRDHPWKVCIDLEVDSSEFKDKVKYITFKDSKNNLTIYFAEALNGRYEGWVELNAVKKDLNGVDFYLYDENGNLLENKNLINFNREKDIQLTIDDKIVKMDHYFQDRSAWWSFYEVFIREDYEGIKKGDVVVDIGANIGMFSAYALKHKASEIFSVEPASDTFKRLKKNIGTYKNVTLVNKGISSEKGESDLFMSPQSGVSSNFSSDNQNDQTQIQTINTIDFTSLVKECDIKKIDFLKIDCEGGEIYLFRNISENYLKNNINKIVCEVHSFAFSQEDYEKIIKSKLIKCGFEVQEEPIFSADDWQNTTAAFMLRAEKKKIKIVHLLNDVSSKREAASINSIKPLAQEGFEYKQRITPLYKNKPPVKNCNRPESVSDAPGHYLLAPGHYGCYLAHKNGILENIDKSSDAILLAECDCTLQLPPKEFSEKVYEAHDLCLKYDLAYVSFGIRALDPDTDQPHDNVESNFYITDKLVGAHCILIPQNKYEFFKQKFETCPWEAADLWYNLFTSEYKKGIFSEPYALWHEGVSAIDQKFIGCPSSPK